ncbi:MAG TPA: hypothetical protein VIL52_06570 [Bacteroidota bacterium]
MRIFLLLSCCFLFSVVAFAQVEPCLNVTSQSATGLQDNSKQSLVQLATQKSRTGSLRKFSPYRPALGVSQYMFDGDSRTAPAMGMQYIPTDNSAHKLTFSGGIVWLPKSSSIVADNRFTGFGRYQYVDGGPYGQSSPSLALAYLGTEYRYYLLQGDIQPYVGAGAHALGWKYGAAWGSTLAPSMIGGVSAEISTIFSGYVELRQLIGLGTVLGTSRFGGSTSVSAGFAFAPKFASW